jgi:hypothetical protein
MSGGLGVGRAKSRHLEPIRFLLFLECARDLELRFFAMIITMDPNLMDHQESRTVQVCKRHPI